MMEPAFITSTAPMIHDASYLHDPGIYPGGPEEAVPCY